ncbi:MAG: hypothetical protein UY41_C0040G0018 [Candidatus Moranbacteria bacterium GW2011_GWE1_49_15]|nr:MAG: hypothetical protein UX75_C0057G0003 [Candidatus Moranbacteria bacterium GW2011_GWE2_47_10]KKW05834.1 MAG: hypothetical protein UY41_C0040G0018 [Candidatus Moranbacteria bacterium GW2011_GWE1_49_15]HBP00884.1 hypothetical protein [Candidatus Moranbacteria bacterium]
MPKIQITARGIRAALKSYTPFQSIVEYVWNGFDAQASKIEINFTANELGGIDSITIKDDGYGIPHGKLQEKFETVFESKKALQSKLKKNLSALHGKNGIGRLTFFTFARNAYWKTVYADTGENRTYDIYANAENINLYTGINAIPKRTDLPTGTEVFFGGVHSLTKYDLENSFQDFLLQEFSWFLALNSKRGFSITVGGIPLDYKKFVADSEEFELNHEKTDIPFSVTYVRWKEKLPKEPSRYYYLDSLGQEKWKESSAIKNKGDKFFHSVFIQSPYFDSFAFQSAEDDGQNALMGGTRSDSQFRFMRKKVANYLRIKRKPFLDEFADKLVLEYEKADIISRKEDAGHKDISQIIRMLYKMQPRLFASLNTEQKKMLVGLLELAAGSDKGSDVPLIINSIIELSNEEKNELAEIFQAS